MKKINCIVVETTYGSEIKVLPLYELLEGRQAATFGKVILCLGYRSEYDEEYDEEEEASTPRCSCAYHLRQHHSDRYLGNTCPECGE